jgi:hypothetical protein
MSRRDAPGRTRDMELLHIETSGNQRFIFATNKLRENVGASQMIWQVGDHARQIAGERGCTVILATSGKATIVAPDRPAAEALVRDVTRAALVESPGVEVHGAITHFDPAREKLADAIGRVRLRHDSLRNAIPPTVARFQRLPCVAECATSGLPAAKPGRGFHGSRKDRGDDLRSAVSQAKWIAAETGLTRLASAAGDVPVMRSIKDLDELDAAAPDWLAVVHADGNGLGQLLMGFDKLVERKHPGADWQTHARELDKFSRELDDCTARAFGTAVRGAWERFSKNGETNAGGAGSSLPLVPLVLGGDDLTVVCDGRFAVGFAADYLRAFERETAEGFVGGYTALAAEARGPGLTACAGVAVIKPHFPFHAAYELAEELLASAKQVKRHIADRGCSALDFHVLYDSSDASLERIRAALLVDGGQTNLTSKPYVVSEGLADHPWAGARTIERLGARVSQLKHTVDGRRRLPNSMLHELRAALFLGRNAADARLELIRGRHDVKHFGPLLAGGTKDEKHSLFHHHAGDSRHAFLLDALELDGFWSDAQPEEDGHG